MNKFTCLLIALLAATQVIAPNTKCALAATDNSFYGRLNTYTAAAAITGTSAEAVDGSVCGLSTAGDMHCAKKTEFKNAITTELNRVKTALTDFGGNVAKLGAMWAKIGSLVNATTVATTIDGLTEAERSTATAAQFKAWAMYTPAAFDTDFTAFKGQAVDCFAAYNQAIKKIGCDAITAQDSAGAYTNPVRWNADVSISITQAGCDYLVEKCGKVWNFMHKFGWFVQIAASLNKKKDTAVVFTAPANLAAIYAPGSSFGTALTLAEIDTAVTKCGASHSATDCVAGEKEKLCRAFFAVWLGGTAPSITPFGRGSAAFMKDYNPASAGTRRMLVAETTGAIKIAASTIDVQTAAAVTLVTDVTFAAGDITAWSTGYVAPSSSSAAVTATVSSKNAQVLFGTVLSFLAVALLN